MWYADKVHLLIITHLKVNSSFTVTRFFPIQMGKGIGNSFLSLTLENLPITNGIFASPISVMDRYTFLYFNCGINPFHQARDYFCL